MIQLRNDTLEIDFDRKQPFPSAYRHLESAVDFHGVHKNAKISINGTEIPSSQWQTSVNDLGAPHCVIYDLQNDLRGYALRFTYELKGYELNLTLSVLNDDHATLRTIELPHPLIGMNAEGCSVWRIEWEQKSWEEKFGRGLWKPILNHSELSASQPDPQPLPAIHCCLYRPGQWCVGFHSNQRYIPLRNQFTTLDDKPHFAIGHAPYTYRVRKKTLDPLKLTIAFLPDLNGDGQPDECDYQLWVNRRLPQPGPTYRNAIWYKIYCGDPGRGVTTSLKQAQEVIERVNRYTDGLPQIAHLVGWQYDGHDSGYPSIDRFNEKLGTKHELEDLHKRCKEDLNTILTYHINLDDSYPKHPGWDPEVICTDPNGGLMRWEEFNGEMSYHINHTKDVETGRVFQKLEAMMKEVPLEGAIHIDAFRNMNWSWEEDGLIGPVEELECGVKPITQWLNERGIEVTTESCDHSAADWTGVVSGILHVGGPKELVQLLHGKMLFGGRFWPPSVWGYGLGTSINWDVIYSECAKEWYDCEWWPLLLDGIYLGTLLYHFYLEREMLCAKLDEVGAHIDFSDDVKTEVNRDNSHLLVTQGDVTIAENFDRFIPRGESIYAFSRDGSSKKWVLPKGFRDRELTISELGDDRKPQTKHNVKETIELELRPRIPIKITVV